MEVRIIPLSEKYRYLLTEYMQKIYPTFTINYIKYNINEAIIGNQKRITSLIVIDEKENIVGCHLSYNTKAWIHGKEVSVAWGHDTYLDSEYRKEIGIDFVLEISAIKNSFGLGLTIINIKLQKLFKTAIFIEGIRKYCVISPWIIWRKCQSIFKATPSIPTFPTEIQVGDISFIQCKAPEDILIPNNGYWNKDICEVDFIRDKDFLNKRFFHNPVHTYTIYTIKGESCYFVVRPIIFRGIYALMFADFRYDHTQPSLVRFMFKAIIRLCNKKKLGAILFTSNDQNIATILKKTKIYKSYPIAFVGGKKDVTSKDSYVLINAADSDGEIQK